MSTTHYYSRAKERANSSRSNAVRFASNARRYGHSPSYYESKLKDRPELEPFFLFLKKKEQTGKKVKVFRGWIFIFNSTNSNPTTVYPVPEEYMQFTTHGWSTELTFKFFHPISRELTMKVRHESVDFPHVRSCFKHLIAEDNDLSSLGPFCVKQNGTIEKDFKVIGMWRCRVR